MSRLVVDAPSAADKRFSEICESIMARAGFSSAGACPLEQAAGFFKMCASQSCGKCTPCRIGLSRLAEDIDSVLDGSASPNVVEQLERTCEALYASADCAIGFQAGRVGLAFRDMLREDAASHIERGVCSTQFTPVPCVKGCPSHVDIPAYIALVRAGRYADAVRVIRNDNPFPSACAFVCEHPCEQVCRRGMIDAPVNIRGMKQRAVLQAGTVAPPRPAPATGKRVAIIGGGPSGLTCAYYLALMGHSVCVYEQNEHLGGMMFYGIPRYRLPEADLQRDIDAILSLGVQVRYNTKVGVQVTWEELVAEYDAVFVGIGAHHFRDLGVEYATREGVMSAVQFLHRVSGNPGAYGVGMDAGDAAAGRVDLSGLDVVVVGGGNVAMDATRTAKRLGAKSVRCVYRRRIDDMTALPEEVAAAAAEGCELVELVAPVRVERGIQKPLALIGQPQMPSQYRAGRPAPRPTASDEVAFECDLLVEAIGQVIEYEYFANKGLKNVRGRFTADEFGQAEGFSNVFLGGDCQTGPSTVIRAIDAGKAAAANIDSFLGFSHNVRDEVAIPQPDFDSKLACGRVNIRERRVPERAADFAGVEIPLTDEEAVQECGRCLRCDHYGLGSLSGGRSQW